MRRNRPDHEVVCDDNLLHLLPKNCIYLPSWSSPPIELDPLFTKGVQMSHSFGKLASCNVLKRNDISLVPLHPFDGDCKHSVKCILCFLEIDKGFATFTMCCTFKSKTWIKYHAAGPVAVLVGVAAWFGRRWVWETNIFTFICNCLPKCKLAIAVHVKVTSLIQPAVLAKHLQFEAHFRCLSGDVAETDLTL